MATRRPRVLPGASAAIALVALLVIGPSHGAQAAPALPTGASPYWVDLTPNLTINPGARSDGGFAWDTKAGHGILFGGLVPNGNPVSSTWTFNGSWHAVTKGSPSAPSARWGIQTTMTYDAAAGYVLLFGGSVGYIGSGANDTWAYSGGAWTDLTSTAGKAPSPRFAASMAYDPKIGGVLLFGGQSSWASSTVYGDTWEFVNGTWTQLHPSASPTARRGANMVYDPAIGGVLLFGGGGKPSGFTALNDTWAFVNGTWHHLTASGPGGRWFGGMAYDPMFQAAVLFGGAGGSGCGKIYGDTWFFQHGAWVNAGARYHLTTHPSARCSLMAAYDPVAGEMIVYGGLAARGNSVATWALR